MPNVIHMKGVKEAPSAQRSRMDTLIITPHLMSTWVIPPFQRPLKVNAKVRAIAEELKQNGGVVSGVITLGQIDNDKTIYLMDGQHRIEAARLSELLEIFVDVRICSFANMGEMGKEFIKLNTAIVKMNPDDMLRGMEGTLATIHNIKERCPFVGYDHIRLHPNSPVLSMAVAIRCWVGSGYETPILKHGASLAIAQELSINEADELTKFLLVARAAWGNDQQNYRLWGSLNLLMTMWMWRALVIKTKDKLTRHVLLNQDQFKKCLMALSAAPDYVDWLVGRGNLERDRAPCYARLRVIFAQRLRQEHDGKQVKMPQPVWG